MSGVFRYANPDAIHWGPGCVEAGLDDELKRLGGTRVFLVTTRSVAGNDALVGPVRELLGGRLVGEYGAIGQHAPLDSIAEAAAAARAARPNLLLSFGGGSPIDAAKVVALALGTGIDLADEAALARMSGSARQPGILVRHVALPTTLSVAELSSGAGMTTRQAREKVGLRVPYLLPDAVFYDATYTLHTPLELWLSTGIRAVDHAVESILAEGEHPFSDALALDGLRRIKAGLLASKADPGDLAARTECQLGAWFSYTLPGPSAAGLSHTLGKRLGSRHGIPHGVTSCLLLPHVMRYLAPGTALRQARIAAALGVDVAGLSPEESAAAAAAAVQELISTLALPQRLGAYGLTDDDLREAVAPVAGERYPTEELLGILRAAW